MTSNDRCWTAGFIAPNIASSICRQPHVRPIVRGKAGHETEFGAKLTASLIDGYTRIERLSWEAYSEAGDFAADLRTIQGTQRPLPVSGSGRQTFSQP